MTTYELAVAADNDPVKVMGIDLGIYKVAWSIWEGDLLKTTGAFQSTYPLRQQQLGDVSRKVLEVVEGYAPDVIWVEDILIGNNRKYSLNLSQTMGAVLAKLSKYDEINRVNVSTWKKDVIGNGRADKNDIRTYIDGLGYSHVCGDDQDRYDAAAIGQYGVKQLENHGRVVQPVRARPTNRGRRSARTVA